MIREIYFLEELETGMKILVYEDVTPADKRADRRTQQKEMVQTGFSILLNEEALVDHEDSGAPFLSSHSGLNISVSHSHDYYAVMLHPSQAVGIDLQRKRVGAFPSALHYFLSEEEMTIPHTDNELYLLWSAKEALYKRKKGKLSSYKEDMQIHAISSGMLLANVEDEFLRCPYLIFDMQLVLVYCS